MFAGTATYWIGNKLVHFDSKEAHDAAEYFEYVTKVDIEREARGLPIEGGCESRRSRFDKCKERAAAREKEVGR